MNSTAFRILATQASKQILIATLGLSVMLMSVGCTAPSATPTRVPTDTSPAATICHG